ncbi:MAG: hypothetical protein EON60_08000 [Alphaproteobacteria bacterium]|nr:MAG: hypothetical protein EON60_08000 [Alphaproteobacteria bacterium]
MMIRSLVAALLMAATAHAEASPTTLLPFEAKMHAGNDLLWLNKDDVMFVNGSKLMRIRNGEMPVRIANGVLSVMCMADDGKSVMFFHTNRTTGGRYMVDTGLVEAITMTPALNEVRRNCARDGGQTVLNRERGGETKAVLQSPHHVFELQVTEGKPRVTVHDKHTLDAKPQVFNMDWTVGGALTDTMSYTLRYNSVTNQAVLYPYLDFEQKRTVWKKNHSLPVMVYDRSGLKTYRVQWFNALTKAGYSILPYGNDLLMAANWHDFNAEPADKAGVWLVQGGHVNRLWTGHVEPDSMALNPDGKTLGFIEESGYVEGVPATNAIHTVRVAW